MNDFLGILYLSCHFLTDKYDAAATRSYTGAYSSFRKLLTTCFAFSVLFNKTTTNLGSSGTSKTSATLFSCLGRVCTNAKCLNKLLAPKHDSRKTGLTSLTSLAKESKNLFMVITLYNSKLVLTVQHGCTGFS